MTRIFLVNVANMVLKWNRSVLWVSEIGACVKLEGKSSARYRDGEGRVSS